MPADIDPNRTPIQIGELALKFGGVRLPLKVLDSPAGFYLGTLDEEGMPYSRESVEYWRKREQAEAAFKDTTRRSWTSGYTLRNSGLPSGLLG